LNLELEAAELAAKEAVESMEKEDKEVSPNLTLTLTLTLSLIEGSHLCRLPY